MLFAARLLVASVLAASSTQSTGDLSYRARGNRYEGVKARPVSGYDIELISATARNASAPNDAAQVLRVQFFLDKARPVFITVRELEYRSYYWLDRVTPAEGWRVRSSNVFSWSALDVLSRLERTKPTDLGVTVRFDRPDPSIVEAVAPALFYSGAAPPRVTGYVFIFRTAMRAVIRAAIKAEPGTTQPLWTRTIHAEAEEAFAVDWAVQSEAERQYRLVLSGYATANNARIAKEVIFTHRAQVDK